MSVNIFFYEPFCMAQRYIFVQQNQDCCSTKPRFLSSIDFSSSIKCKTFSVLPSYYQWKSKNMLFHWVFCKLTKWRGTNLFDLGRKHFLTELFFFSSAVTFVSTFRNIFSRKNFNFFFRMVSRYLLSFFCGFYLKAVYGHWQNRTARIRHLYNKTTV
jgi:hypothetical protein